MMSYEQIIKECNLRELTPKSLDSIKNKFKIEQPINFVSKQGNYAISISHVDETLNGNKIGEPFAILISFNSLKLKGYYLMNYDFNTIHKFYEILRQDNYGRQILLDNKLLWKQVPNKILMIKLGYV